MGPLRTYQIRSSPFAAAVSVAAMSAIAIVLLVSGVSSPAGALPIDGTTTTLPVEDGTGTRPTPASIDPFIDQFRASYPSSLIPAIVTSSLPWSTNATSASAEAIQRAQVGNWRNSLISIINGANTSTEQSVLPSTQPGISPILAAKLTPAAMEALRWTVGVKAIDLDRTLDPADDQILDPTMPTTTSTNSRVNESTNLQQRFMGADQLHSDVGGGGDVTGAGTAVAVIDTGVSSRPNLSVSLSGRVVDGVCFSNNPGPEGGICPGGDRQNNPTVGGSGACSTAVLGLDAAFNTNFWCGHGTGVAETIAGGTTNNPSDGRNYWSGIAPEAKLLSIAAYHFTTQCDKGQLKFNGVLPGPPETMLGARWCGGVSISDLHRSLDWVFARRSTHNIAAVNMSMGWFNTALNDNDCDNASTGVVDATARFLKLLSSANIPAIGASGNWNESPLGKKRPRVFPACISTVVSTAATAWEWSASNKVETMGNNSQGSTGIDLVSPGLSPDRAFVAATSGSTATTSGAFALLRQAVPWAKATDVETALKQTGKPIYMPLAMWPTGYPTDQASRSKPRIDLVAALASLRRGLAVVPLAQTRIADSRLASTSVQRGATCGDPGAPLGTFMQAAPASSQRLNVTGRGGVPIGASGVVINVTATETTASSFATVWGANAVTGAAQSQPRSSNLNWNPGETVANTTIVVPDAQGCISIFNNLGYAHFIVDVMGYLDSTSTAGSMTMLPTPRRSPDSGLRRSGNFEMRIAGTQDVPSDVTAVWLSISANQSTAGSASAIAPATVPSTYPNANLSSNINFASNSQNANLALVKVGANGKVALNNLVGSALFELDVVGYLSPSSSQRIYPLAPQRILDTRCTGGAVWCTTYSGSPVGTSGTAVRLPATVGNPPNTSGLFANVTVSQPSVTTHVVAWSGSGTIPYVSTAHGVPQRDRANALGVPLVNNQFTLTPAAGSAHLIVDLYAYVK